MDRRKRLSLKSRLERRHRTVGDPLSELLAADGKSGLVRSALADLCPEAPGSDLDYLTRWISDLMSEGLSPEAHVEGTLREALVQRAERDPRLRRYQPRLVELVLDLDSLKSAFR